jgi:hypothetical protein
MSLLRKASISSGGDRQEGGPDRALLPISHGYLVAGGDEPAMRGKGVSRQRALSSSRHRGSARSPRRRCVGSRATRSAESTLRADDPFCRRARPGGAAALPRFRWLATEPVPTASTGIDSGREVPAASSSTGPSAATRSSSSMSARCSPSTGQRGSSGSFWRVTGCFSARDRAVVPASAPRGYSSSEDGLPDPSPDEEWMHLGSEASRTQRPSLRERPSLRGGGRREPGQRGSRRAGRVRPVASSFAAQCVISERSHSLTRPAPRSTAGFGMSL